MPVINPNRIPIKHEKIYAKHRRFTKKELKRKTTAYLSYKTTSSISGCQKSAVKTSQSNLCVIIISLFKVTKKIKFYLNSALVKNDCEVWKI